MSAYFVKAAVLSDGTIFPDVVVITDVDETTCQVVVLELLGGVVLGLAGGGTVDDDETHGVVGHRDAALDIGEEPVLVLDEETGNGQRILFLNHNLSVNRDVRGTALQHRLRHR